MTLPRTAVGLLFAADPPRGGFFMPAQPDGACMSFAGCLFVVLGGVIGTLARFVISVAALPVSQHLPWGTIYINVAGSFVIGLFGTLTLTDGRYPVDEKSSPVRHGGVLRRLHHLLGFQPTNLRAAPRRLIHPGGDQHHRLSGSLLGRGRRRAFASGPIRSGAERIAQLEIEEDA